MAHELECSYVDLGASNDTQTGLIRFKRNYGAEEREIRDYHYNPLAESAGAGRKALLGHVTGLLTLPAVPDHFTRLAGALLYRYFV